MLILHSLRKRAWELFGIEAPKKVRVGQIFYPQPPKRIIVLQRHITRNIVNIDDLMARLRLEFGERRGVEVELVSTASLLSAEDTVRTFSRAGVLITPHGSQSQGQIWQPRHSAIVEIMPVGYTDYAFSLLADSCKIWYYEIQGLVDEKNPARTQEYYERNCKERNRLWPCSAVKNHGVLAPLDEIVHTVINAFERIGHSMDFWQAPRENETNSTRNTTLPSDNRMVNATRQPPEM